MRIPVYVIYEIDDDKYWCGGTNWSYDYNDAMFFRTSGEVEAAMEGLYRRSSSYNLMYRILYQVG